MLIGSFEKSVFLSQLRNLFLVLYSRYLMFLMMAEHYMIFFSLILSLFIFYITSYGQNISLSLSYRSLSDTPDEHISIRFLIINEEKGNLTWIKKFSTKLLLSSLEVIQISLTEQSLMKEVDSNVMNATREDVMRILSSIKSIHIRATQTSYPAQIHISNITMDILDYTKTDSDDYADVEVCDCPEGYTGSSCERCDKGFYKSAISVCVECPCNGHKCSFDNGEVTCECADNFTGKHCEVTIEKPSIVKGPANVTLGKIGSKLTLNCTIADTPETHVSWYFQADSSEYTIKHSGCPPFVRMNCSVKISNLDVKDEGLYTCAAYNKMGNVSTSTYLRTYVEEIRTKTSLEVISMKCLKIATGVLSFLCILVLIPIAILWALSCRRKKLNTPPTNKSEEAEL